MGTQVCERVGSLPFASGALFSSPQDALILPAGCTVLLCPSFSTKPVFMMLLLIIQVSASHHCQHGKLNSVGLEAFTFEVNVP